ncbi:MAG TPA: carboxypeptidase-like regulatory domain-containing protein [Bryobacteraceae bacterium]|jgi:hypothetical protein|nr:carboxypeptidase-like regulatory domain-containing protein [Bryobacteraceae bacterium]
MTLLLVVCLLLVQAQQPDTRHAKRTIYGIVIGQDGNPAKGVGLTACPLGVPLGAVLPHTKTDQSGKYRFENIPWWGRYTVYAEDPDAGYSSFSTGPSGPGDPKEVTLSPERSEAEFNFRLPPKAVFLEIHLTNRRTGAVISEVQVTVMSMQDPARLIFSENCASDHVILIPTDRGLLLHITSRGFREWDDSAGRGKLIRAISGTRLKLDVQLAPAD